MPLWKQHSNKIYKWYLDEFVSFVVLLIPNLFVWIILFPGYFQADHQATIAGIINGQPSEWHSLVWGYIFYLGVLIFHSYDFAGFLQSLVFAVFIFLGIYNLKKYKVIKRCWIFSLVMALFPTFLMYNQLYASDMIFAYSLFTLTCLLICYAKKNFAVENCTERCQDKKNIACNTKQDVSAIFTMKNGQFLLVLQICVFTVIACLMRKNACVIPVIFGLIAIICYKRKAILIVISSFIAIIVAIFVPIVIDASVGAEKSPSQEMLSIPAVQIATAYKYGVVPDDCRPVFEKYRSAEDWIKNYSSTSADSEKIRLKPDLDFLIAWLKTGVENKKLYICAHLGLIYEFFDFGASALLEPNGEFNGTQLDFSQQDNFTTSYLKLDNDLSIAYASHFGIQHSAIWYKLVEVYPRFVNSVFGTVNFVGRCVLFNRGLPFWVMLIGAIVSIRKKTFKQFAVYVAPSFAIFLTFIFFAPVALFRYSVTLYYAMFAIIVAVYKFGLSKNASHDHE